MSSLIEFLSDAIIWYTLALVIVLWAVVHFGGKGIVSFLDSEIVKIRTDIEEAARLRKEAEAFLADAQAKQVAALAEAKEIISHAQTEAARLNQEAAEDLKNRLIKQEQRAVEKITQAEVQALAEVRAETIALAVDAARKNLAANTDESLADRLIDDAIGALPKLVAK